MNAVTINTVVMICLAMATLAAIVHPKIETGFWVTLGLAGIFIGCVAALDPGANPGKVALLMALGNLLVTIGLISRTAQANKNCRLSGWGRRATDDVICGRWTERSDHRAPPVSES